MSTRAARASQLQLRLQQHLLLLLLLRLVLPEQLSMLRGASLHTSQRCSFVAVALVVAALLVRISLAWIANFLVGAVTPVSLHVSERDCCCCVAS
jgi:hypothetical protein